MLRRMRIIRGETVLFEGFFNNETVTDSEMLHKILCEIDPGDEYTIMFDGPGRSAWQGKEES